MFERILVVCMGNICRSPIAEAVLKSLLPNKQVSSAGIATETSGLSGAPVDSTMYELAESSGLKVSEHKAQQLSESLCDTSDLILVMEPEHMELVSIIAPNARHKTLLFGQWSGGSIADPYQKSQSASSRALQEIQLAGREWAAKLA